MKKNTSIRNIKTNFSEKRREIKSDYINRFGTTKGVKSSKEYKQTLATQKSLETRVRNSYAKNAYEGKIEPEIRPEQGKTQKLSDVDIITSDGLFFDVLNESGENGDVFFYALEESRAFNYKKTVVVIEDFKGKVKVYREDVAIDKAIAELYREAARLQNTKGNRTISGKGKNKKRVTTTYPVVSVASATISGINYVTISAKFDA